MKKILIIDDNLANREILRMRLERLGHEVVEAEDGEAGLRCVETETPALIFLDVMMPKKDGWQVCKILKTDPKTQKTPVVMLTALQEPPGSQRATECGADDFMSKPWDPAHLKKIVERWLPA